jgi:hypothetical protein
MCGIIGFLDKSERADYPGANAQAGRWRILTDDFVALPTEEIALRRALGRRFVACKAARGTVQIGNTRGKAQEVI